MYKLYILYSHKIDKYYIGYSYDVDQRLRKHNNASKGFTKTGRPWILAYTEEHETKQEAAARERQIKNRKNRSLLEDLLPPTR
jgi:putative endonuclease